jgi:hypothetical protein
VDMAGVEGTLRISTAGSRVGEQVEGTLSLAPWEGVIGAAVPSQS